MAARSERDKYRCQTSFDSIMPIIETEPSISQSLRANNTNIGNNILLQPQTSRTNTQTRKKKIRHKFKNYLDSQPTGINIKNCKKNFFDSLEAQSTTLGEWVKNNRCKAETFLKDWNS